MDEQGDAEMKEDIESGSAYSNVLFVDLAKADNQKENSDDDQMANEDYDQKVNADDDRKANKDYDQKVNAGDDKKVTAEIISQATINVAKSTKLTKDDDLVAGSPIMALYSGDDFNLLEEDRNASTSKSMYKKDRRIYLTRICKTTAIEMITKLLKRRVWTRKPVGARSAGDRKKKAKKPGRSKRPGRPKKTRRPKGRNNKQIKNKASSVLSDSKASLLSSRKSDTSTSMSMTNESCSCCR